MQIEVQHIQYHRNGISGHGFYSVAFRWADDSGDVRNMLGIVFDEEEHRNATEFYNCRTAVVDRDFVTPQQDGNTGPFGWGIPCWRGDHFDRPLREAIIAARDADDVLRGIAS